MTSTYLLQTDMQRSTLGGVAFPSRAYGAYGTQACAAGPLMAFAGQMRDADTGWYHLGNGRRVFNPVLMRFHTADRLSPFDKGGVNAYAYCLGDPVNRHDPSGQFAQAIGPILGAMTNTLGLLSTGLKARNIYRVHQTYRTKWGNSAIASGQVAGNQVDTQPARMSRLEMGISAVSAVTGAIGLVTSLWRLFDKNSDAVMYIGFVTSAIAIVTTGYEVNSLARSKPWNRYPIDQESIGLRMMRSPTPRRYSRSSSSGSAASGSIRGGSTSSRSSHWTRL